VNDVREALARIVMFTGLRHDGGEGLDKACARVAEAILADSALLDDICEYRAHQLNEEGRPIRDDLCWSTGPRVGGEGRPYCLLPLGHTGLHISHHESGFFERWGDPALRASASDRENAWLPEDGDSDA